MASRIPAAVEGPDTAGLKVTPFARGEWSYDERAMADVAFSSLVAALGDEDDPLESISVPRLLAVVYPVCSRLFEQDAFSESS